MVELTDGGTGLDWIAIAVGTAGGRCWAEMDVEVEVECVETGD